MFPQYGGYSNYLNDKDSYLITHKDILSKLENYTIVESKNDYYLVKHSSNNKQTSYYK